MWKPIEFEPQYEVSRLGEVRNKETLQIKSLRFSRAGYLRVTLYPSGKTYTVHRVVAQTWLPNKENLPSVNHKNGIKTDNSVDNLEWCTAQYNTLHGIHVIKTIIPANWNGDKNPEAKLDFGIVHSIKFGILNKFTNNQLALMLGVDSETIRRIRKEELWAHVKQVN